MFRSAAIALICLAVGCERASEPAAAETAATTSRPAVTAEPRKPAEVVADDDAQQATTVIHDYYRAIASHDYARAFACWGSSGPPGQTLEHFTKGFEDTATVKVETGTPSRVEGAAGSRYVEIPVTVMATTKAGESQRFEGTYVLRRSVVDGASTQERAWHLYGASLRHVAVQEPVASSSYLNSVAPKRTASPSFKSA